MTDPNAIPPQDHGDETTTPQSKGPDTASAAADEETVVVVTDPKDSQGGGWRFLREIAIVVVCALVLSVVVRTFFLQAFYVPSESMENTLLVNDRILASKITTNISGVKRGEVIVFKDPGGWLPDVPDHPNVIQKGFEFIGLLPTNSGDDLVKRAIALGGDHIMCCNTSGQIVLNGVGLEEPYIKPGDTTNQINFDEIVPADSVFVMGDNRSDSADSRYHLNQNKGAVPTDNVVGRAVVIVWPFDHWGTLPIPDVPFGNPAVENQSAQPSPTPAPN